MFRPILLRSFTALLAAVVLAGAARAAATWAETLTARALSAGASSRLPPHLSAVLGITSNDQGLAVRQLIARDGFTVRTFNVGLEAPHTVVVMVVDEAARASVAYLVTRRGRLRKAVEYHSGEEPRELSAAQAQPRYSAEVRFWSSAAATAAPAAAH